MNIIKILESCPGTDDDGKGLHGHIFSQLSGMFSDCKLEQYTELPKFMSNMVIDKPGVYERCNIITFAPIYPRLIVDGITDGKLSFGHDGMDEFFKECYNSVIGFKVNPRIDSLIKLYLNTTLSNVISFHKTYPIYGNLEEYFNSKYFDRVWDVIKSPNNKNNILVFDVDRIIIDSRVPSLETELQRKLSYPCSLYQSDVEIMKRNSNGKKYKIAKVPFIYE